MLTSEKEAHYIEKQIKKSRKMAEYFLLNYEYELKNYREAKDEYISPNHSDVKTNNNCSITEITAIKEIEFNKKYIAYRWLKAVEIVQKNLSERKNIFIIARRIAEKNKDRNHKRRAWVAYTQKKYNDEMERRKIISDNWLAEKTVRAWWYDIINKTILIAGQINY